MPCMINFWATSNLAIIYIIAICIAIYATSFQLNPNCIIDKPLIKLRLKIIVLQEAAIVAIASWWDVQVANQEASN